jgi:hypothetical protein
MVTGWHHPCSKGLVTDKTRMFREKEMATKHTHAAIMLDRELPLDCGCMMPPQ